MEGKMAKVPSWYEFFALVMMIHSIQQLLRGNFAGAFSAAIA